MKESGIIERKRPFLAVGRRVGKKRKNKDKRDIGGNKGIA